MRDEVEEVVEAAGRLGQRRARFCMGAAGRCRGMREIEGRANGESLVRSAWKLRDVGLIMPPGDS